MYNALEVQASMNRYITETLERAKFLVHLSLEKGSDAFAAELTLYAHSIAKTYPDDYKEVNRRFLALISGITAVFFDGQTERIIRNQLHLSDQFIHESSVEKKIELFVREVTQFVETHTQLSASTQLCSRVKLHLKLCSLDELRGLCVTSLAQHFGYHPDHFSKILKHEIDALPSDLIVEEKMRRAAMMIKGKPDRTNIKEIAFSLGYQDYSHFRSLIKKHLGTLPSKL
jgi:AraC-like DNA-binding protein